MVGLSQALGGRNELFQSKAVRCNGQFIGFGQMGYFHPDRDTAAIGDVGFRKIDTARGDEIAELVQGCAGFFRPRWVGHLHGQPGDGPEDRRV
jgi:hypothetical protein